MPETDVIPTSASIASTGTGIRYIGEHCYAYSGTSSASTGDQTILSFRTGGAGYIIGKLWCNGGVEDGTIGNGTLNLFTVKLNGLICALIKTETATEDMPVTNKNKFLIPPGTLFEVITQSSSNDAGSLLTAVFVGRVYGAE